MVFSKVSSRRSAGWYLDLVGSGFIQLWEDKTVHTTHVEDVQDAIT